MSTSKGHRDLNLLRASGSTARVLNLSFIQEKFGATEEYAARPFFRSRRLNRAIFVKHAVRRSELDLFVRPPITATKIILPYSTTDLGLGGVSLFVGQQGFRANLKDGVGGFDDVADFEADVELLEMLDALPSFDPFVMRERLRQGDLEPAPCYFDISEADLGRMRDFVAREISQLVKMAFRGGAGGRDLSVRMADKLMTDASAKALEPLRQTLNLSGPDYAEGVFAWKAFLYYSWSLTEFAPEITALHAAISKASILKASTKELHEIGRLRLSMLAQMNKAAARIESEIAGYKGAFTSLTEGGASRFRDFLLKAPDLFIPMGEAIGLIKHVRSYWGYRFPKTGAAPLSADEAIELFDDLDRSFSALAFCADAAPDNVLML
ncbi:MAG: hypothetical protein GC189_10630 [Alphaproteobacteria bacterium]|nr:hypothetical protein [Alphaproteobacteria bacterium]